MIGCGDRIGSARIASDIMLEAYWSIGTNVIASLSIRPWVFWARREIKTKIIYYE